MAGADALLTVAEMAIGLAGFSAVVAAFTTRGQLTPQDRSRFLWLFTTAFAAALLAFVPIVLSEASLEGAHLWRASSSIMVVIWVLTMGSWGVTELRERRDPSIALNSFAKGPLLVVPSIANVTLQAINVWGGAWEASAAIYILGTLCWLYAAALVFMSMVIERSAA